MLIWIVGIVSSLGLVGAIAAVIAVPGIAIPILSKVTSAVLGCKPCLALLAAIALLFTGALYGVHVERQRCDARIEAKLDQARRDAAAAALDRDAGVREDLEKSYGPAMSALRRLAEGLQQKVDENAKRKPVATSGAKPVSCKLGDAARLLQPAPPVSGSAGAIPGRPADHVRGDPQPRSGAGRSAGRRRD